ncbi:MAG: tRNA dihydrouridine synthase [Planctomycetota bacterium]
MSTSRLPFTAPFLLAPMEGVTEPCFRDLVLARNGSDRLGGAFTEFVRVVRDPVPRKILRAHLGPHRHEAPVGLQLMGSDLAALAETARRAAEIGAPLVDLNFGCPAKGAIAGCAGSALLRDPRALEAVVAECARAVESVPVTAKIRAGYDDDRSLEDLARAAEAGGAAMLTVHCRTRAEAYQDEVDWNRIARAVSSVAIPVCGNGGVSSHADLERMRAETGCALAMVGRAALGDPWIFSGAQAVAADAARFLLDYADSILAHGVVTPKGAAGRVKQLLRHWTAGGLADPDRHTWMRETDPERLLERLRSIAGERRDPVLNPKFSLIDPQLVAPLAG